MPSLVTVNLDRPIASVAVVSGSVAAPSQAPRQTPAAGADPAVPSPAQQAQIERCETLCRALQEAVDRVHQVYASLVAGHSEAIARLSTEIARKIIKRKIDDGDYDMAAIVTETLSHAPGMEVLTIRLNPQDLAVCQAAREAGQTHWAGIELTADAEIARGDCLVESPQGVVKSFIDEHLEQIEKALGKTA